MAEVNVQMPSGYRTRNGSSLREPTQRQGSGVQPIPPEAGPHQPQKLPLAELIDELMAPELHAETETQLASTSSHPGRMIWEPAKLNGRHREIMRRLVEGSTREEIAADLGMSYQAIQYVTRSAIFQEELAKLQADADFNVIRRAESLSNEAMDHLRDTMRHSGSERMRMSASIEILGIGGYGKIEKKQVAIVSGEDVIRELNRRRRERDVSPNRHNGEGPSDGANCNVAKEDVTASSTATVPASNNR